MRLRDDFDFTSNSKVFKRLLWEKRCTEFGYCSYCGPHGPENGGWHNKKKKTKKAFQLNPKRRHKIR